MAVKKTAPRSRLPRVLELIGKPLLWLVILLLKLALIGTRKLTLLFILLVGLGWWTLRDLPNPNQLITRQQPLTTKIYDRNGELLYKIYRNQNRTLVKLEDVSPYLIRATVAIEDAEFYQHRGFSLKAITRAFFRDLKGDKLFGGSTITQQLVKNTLLTPEKTLRRKIKEVILAFAVELKFSKEEILQMYLNEVNYGGTAYGVEESAFMYFDKTAKDLTLAESALLAGLPASPTNYSPFGAHPELAKDRQQMVLKRMREEGFIDRQEEEKAGGEKIALAPQKIDIKAPHFVMFVKDLLVKKYGEKMVEEGGLEVKTSLDLNLQNQAQEILTSEINKLKNLRIGNGAALVTNPKNGEILAMVGSKDYFDIKNDGNVNVTIRSRQPGSSIKPVTYSLALEKGFTAASILSDTPITYQVAGQPPYSPRNYDSKFHGNVTLRTALASSYNVPAVKVLAALGVEKMIDQGQAMGITTWEEKNRFGLSLTLGGGEVKMTDMAVVYGTLANLGYRVDLNPILEVKNSKGQILESNSHFAIDSSPTVNPSIAYILNDILSDNKARTPTFGLHSWLNIANHPNVAVKTGTTQNLRDNWTIGYTPDYLVAVWVGNNDNKPMSYVASGVTGASPIWNRIMSALLKDIPDKKWVRPQEVIEAKACDRTELFVFGTESTVRCLPSPTPAPII